MRKLGIECTVPGFFLLVAAVAGAQTLRFDVDVVQVDAVVTGRDGRRAAGLKADDFEVLQDGKAQKITHFSYVSGSRTTVIVVDDIGMELADFVSVRQALTRFIDQEMHAGDLVSLVYTSRGSGALRQFTSDTKLLHRAVDRISWRPPTGVQTVFPGMSFLREMNQVITELGSFPGRKAVVLIAPVSRAEMADVRGIADIANRASVTVYGVDLLAQATGGLSVHATSAAFEQLREASEDASGYYLIGWYPGADAFRHDPKHEPAYHKLQIRMHDKSLHARTRDGYFARPGTPGPRTFLSTREALISPFRGGDLEVDLTAAFQGQEAAGSYVDSMLHIGGKSVRLEQDAGGCWNARLEVERAIWAVDPWASQNDRVNEQVLDVHACGKEAEQVRQEGLVAVVEDRVPTPGSYQVRVTVRNAGSDPVGSATQFLVIPDLKRTRLAVSGVTAWAGDAPAAPSGDVTYRPASEGDPAMRQFHAGGELRYSFRVLGAATDVRLRVLRDGKEAATAPVTVGAGGAVTGVLPLMGLTPGRYVLGAVASMAPGKEKTQSAEEWVDFEIR